MDDTDCPSQPESLMMDRSETGPKEPPPMESLRRKLLAHYQKGVKRPKLQGLSSPLTPEAVNRIAVPLYLFTVFSTLKIGLFHVMPQMYEGNDTVIFVQQAVVIVLATQLMINWIGIRYVNSSYSWYICKNGDPLVKRALAGNTLTQKINQRDSSSAMLMSLITEDASTHSTNGHAGLEQRDLGQEAAQANAEMNKVNQQISSRSIADLISVTTDSNSNQQQHSITTEDIISPKPVITTNGKVVTKTYPYWSWVPCYDCNRTRPPRCHHCPVCRTCVLKRDHHCFFAGACVGYRNHRFFYVFLIWAWLSCIYATLHGFPYIAWYLWQDMSYFDVFFPITIMRFILGYQSFLPALTVTTLTLLLYFDAITMTFIYAHTCLIAWGLTSFEKAYLKSSLEIKDTRSLRQKIRAVFGSYWALSIIIPTHFFFEPEENPIDWPYVQVNKH